MDRKLVHLEDRQLDDVVWVSDDGAVVTDTQALALLVSKAVGLVGVRVAISSADYLQHDDGTPEPAARTASGIWWHPHGDDSALIGGFIIEGHAMTITTEGAGEAPLAEDANILERATKAIASQYEGAEIVETGLVRVNLPSGEKLARVVVTRDYRVRRLQDILSADEIAEFDSGRLGLAIVQLIGGEKALVIKHGL